MAVAPPPAPHRRHASAAGRAPPVRGDPRQSCPRPSSGAARPSTTTPRPMATARCRSGSTSTSAPASRAGAAVGRSSGSWSAPARRTSARGASACPAADRAGARRSCGRCRAVTCVAAGAGPSSTGRTHSVGRPRSRGSAAAARSPADGAHPTGGRDPPGSGRASAGSAGPSLMSILRSRGRDPRGRHVRHPRRHRGGGRARRPDRPRRSERRRQDDAAAAGRGTRRAGPRHGPAQARAVDRPARPGGPLRRRVHGLARPPDGGPDRRGASRDAWPPSWPPWSATAA